MSATDEINKTKKYVTAVYPENSRHDYFEVDGNIEFRQICIDDILKYGAEYWSLSPSGARAKIHVVPNSPNTKPDDQFLRTDRNNTPSDNLGELPAIPDKRIVNFISERIIKQVRHK